MTSLLVGLALVPYSFTRDDVVLLNDLQRRSVDFFWKESPSDSGFTRDRAPNRTGVNNPSPASSAAVGFALVAYPIGVERGWLKRKEALARTRLTLRSLNTKWPHKNGFLYHFIDVKTHERVWKCEASSIDTSICLAGAFIAERYWKDPEVTREVRKLAARIDWKWMLTDGGAKPDAVHVCMGWRPEEGFLGARWENYDENKMLYAQAYGLADNINRDGWKQMVRKVETYNGVEFIRGGPLFIHQMSESFYDFRGLRDEAGFNYTVASRNAAIANRQYCIDNPKGMKAYGPNFWGLSASDVPTGYGANGAPGWISDDGTITPTSAVAAVQWIPKEAMEFAHAMRKDHAAAWGRYGFPNGYNPNHKWTGPDVIGIDLGMMLLAIENVRSGLPIKLSMSHPVIQKGFRRMGLRKVAGSDSGPLQVSP
jgi:hypothetical protein